MNGLTDKFWDWALGDAARNPEPFYEDADLEWVTAVLPLLVTLSAIHDAGPAAIEHFGPQLGPDWSKFKTTDMKQVFTLVQILPRHMDTLDPEGTSGAYRMLENWDPKFRKITIIGNLYTNKTVELPKELYDLEFLGSWLFVNVMARFSRMNMELAEESVHVLTETMHFRHYIMVIEQGKTLGDVRADRLWWKQWQNARKKRYPMVRLQFEIPPF